MIGYTLLLVLQLTKSYVQTHPSELLADTKSTLYERLKPLAVVDDLSSLQKAYVETLSG